MNRIFKVLEEYDRFYLCTNGIYRECFYKDEYKPIHNIIYKKDYYFIINHDIMKIEEGNIHDRLD